MNSEKPQANKAPEASKPKSEEKKTTTASKPQGQDRPRPRRDDREPRDEKDRRGPRHPASRREGQPPREGNGAKPAAPASGTSSAKIQGNHVNSGSTWNKNSGLSFADMVRQKRDAKPAAAAPPAESQKAAPPAKRASEAPASADATAAESQAAPVAREAPAAAAAVPAEVPVVAQAPVAEAPPTAPAAHAPSAPTVAAPAPAAAMYYVLEMDRRDQSVELPLHVIKAAGMNMDVYRFSAIPGAAPKAAIQPTMPVASQQQPQAIYSQNAANLPLSQRWMSPTTGGADARVAPTQQSQPWANDALFHSQWAGSGADRGIPAQRFPVQYGGASPFDIAQGTAGSNANFLSYRTGRPNGGDAAAMRQMPSQQQQQQAKPQTSFVRTPFQNSNGVW